MATVMVMNDATPFVQCQSTLPFWDTAISKFDHENPWSRSCVWSKGQGHIWPSNFKGQDYGQGQTHWSHLRPGVQSICLLFISWQSDHFWLRYRKFHIWPWKFKVKVMAKVKPNSHIWGIGVQSICLLFNPWQSDHFWLRYSKFHIWPWKFKVKVMAKVKPDGCISALEFNWYVCFSFRGNRTIFGWDIANSIFDLEKSRSRSLRKSTKIYSGNLQVRANNHAKNERNPKSCSKVIAWTRSCGRRRRRTNWYKNIKSPPVYRGDLITRTTRTPSILLIYIGGSQDKQHKVKVTNVKNLPKL